MNKSEGYYVLPAAADGSLLCYGTTVMNSRIGRGRRAFTAVANSVARLARLAFGSFVTFVVMTAGPAVDHGRGGIITLVHSVQWCHNIIHNKMLAPL